MSALDNLSTGELQDILRRLRVLETAAGLQSSSIGAGGLRVHSGGVITIENGGLKVTGSAEIIGSLVASGTIEFNGPVDITGPLTIAGKADITGPTKVTGNLDVEGGGQIKAGNTRISPSAANGGIEFVSGGGVGGNGGTVAMRGSSDAGFLAGTTAGMFAGGVTLTVSPTQVTISGLPTTTTGAANVHMDSSGRLYRKI